MADVIETEAVFPFQKPDDCVIGYGRLRASLLSVLLRLLERALLFAEIICQSRAAAFEIAELLFEWRNILVERLDA